MMPISPTATREDLIVMIEQRENLISDLKSVIEINRKWPPSVIEACASEVECTDWIIPLQGKPEVDEFGKQVALIVLRQAARQVRAMAEPHDPNL